MSQKKVTEVRPLLDVRDGDPSVVFTMLFNDHAAELHRYLARRVGALADDLVANTFVAALAGRASYDPSRAEPRAWLYGIATNMLRRHWRQEQLELVTAAKTTSGGEPTSPGPEAVVPGQVEAAQRCRQLASALVGLADGDRDVLLLTAWAGLDSNEIAAALDIPVGTVRSRLHRVRRQLRTISANIDKKHSRIERGDENE